MSRMEELVNSVKTNELLSELLNKKKEEEKTCNKVLWVLAIIGAIAAVAAIAYAVYRYLAPDCLEDFDDDDIDYGDEIDYDDDFFDEEDDEEAAEEVVEE